MSGSLRMYLSNHEQSARPSAFAEATADRRSAKRQGWSTSSGRAVRQFNCSPGLAFVPGDLDPALPEALVILLARILHHLPVGPERERPRVRPRLGECLGIVDDHFVRDVSEVGPREALDQVQLLAMRVANRIQASLAIEIDGVDHQRVAFPMTH